MDEPRKHTSFGPPSLANDITAVAERAPGSIAPQLAHHVSDVGVGVGQRAQEAMRDEPGTETACALTAAGARRRSPKGSVDNVARQSLPIPL